MNTLPKVPITKALEWGVCQRFGSLELLAQTTAGRTEVDALEMLDLPIRDVDKLWLVMRLDTLPRNVLDAALDRILGGLPSTFGQHLRGGQIEISRQAGLYWEACRHALACARDLLGRGPVEENHRQYSILQEETNRWVNSPS